MTDPFNAADLLVDMDAAKWDEPSEIYELVWASVPRSGDSTPEWGETVPFPDGWSGETSPTSYRPVTEPYSQANTSARRLSDPQTKGGGDPEGDMPLREGASPSPPPKGTPTPHPAPALIPDLEKAILEVNHQLHQLFPEIPKATPGPRTLYPELILSATPTARRFTNNIIYNDHHRVFFQPTIQPQVVAWNEGSSIKRETTQIARKWSLKGAGRAGPADTPHAPSQPIHLFGWSTSAREEYESPARDSVDNPNQSSPSVPFNH